MSKEALARIEMHEKACEIRQKWNLFLLTAIGGVLIYIVTVLGSMQDDIKDLSRVVHLHIGSHEHVQKEDK